MSQPSRGGATTQAGPAMAGYAAVCAAGVAGLAWSARAAAETLPAWSIADALVPAFAAFASLAVTVAGLRGLVGAAQGRVVTRADAGTRLEDGRAADWWGPVLWVDAACVLVIAALVHAFRAVDEFVARAVLGVLALAFAWMALSYTRLAVAASAQARRYGVARLTLSPAQPRLGEPWDATVRFDRGVPGGTRLRATLSAMSRPFRSSFDRETWSARAEAPVNAAADGAILKLRFEVPAELPPTNMVSRNRTWWSLVVDGEVDGQPLRRDFRVPIRPRHADAIPTDEAATLGPMLRKEPT